MLINSENGPITLRSTIELKLRVVTKACIDIIPEIVFKELKVLLYNKLIRTRIYCMCVLLILLMYECNFIHNLYTTPSSFKGLLCLRRYNIKADTSVYEFNKKIIIV